ncbi:hypothetical protein D0Y65_036274, partial [Glycine soja]
SLLTAAADEARSSPATVAKGSTSAAAPSRLPLEVRPPPPPLVVALATRPPSFWWLLVLVPSVRALQVLLLQARIRSKTEVNLKRLLAAAPQQQNQAKLVHYVATLREQLEQLAEERAPEGLPRISKAVLNDYSEKIEAIASKLVNHVSDPPVPKKDFERNSVEENSSEIEETKQILLSSGLRRRPVPASSTEERAHKPAETDHISPVKLDAAAHAHIEKHRMLQDNLTDEMVVLAKQLKESSLMMSQSLQNTEKILDSTEKAIEHSLASTGRANVRATAIYSESSKTSCLTWLVMFVMTCVFVMVILLIRVT